jgi:hypothetical protein
LVNKELSASSGSAASFPVVIIAAVAGGALLLILIIVVIAIRRKRTPDADRDQSKSRNVVAFENPMYDTTSKPERAAPVKEEGLYDEPAKLTDAAFGEQANKDNPLYDSAEKLYDGEFQQTINMLRLNAASDTDTDGQQGFTLSHPGDDPYGTESAVEDQYLDVAPSYDEDV